MTDIAKLFAEDPLRLTAADFIEDYEKAHGAGRRPLDDIIKYYRTARANFNLGEKAAGSTKKMKATGEPGPKVTTLDLDKLLG